MKENIKDIQEKDIEEWEALKASVRLFTALDKRIKEKFRGVSSTSLGKYEIEGEEIYKKGYIVSSTSYWKTTIRRIDKEKGEKNESV